MGWKRLSLLAVVVLVLPVFLMAGCSGPTAMATSDATDEIIVRISSKGVIVTDEQGRLLPAISVDAKDPVGSIVRRVGRPVKLLSGGAPVEFSFETNPNCTCRCEGGECRCRPDGCVQ
jgi:hypothetical protein